MKTTSFLIIVFIGCTFACSKKNTTVECLMSPCPEDFNPIYLRLENGTNQDFTYTQAFDQEYGMINAGDTSNYTYLPDGGFHYGYVEVITIQNDTFTIQPIDYVGETPLETGYYTYRLYFEVYGQDTILRNEFVID